MKNKNYQKNREMHRMDNPIVHRYNEDKPNSFMSEDQALRFLAGVLVEAHMKIKKQSHG